MAKIDSVVDAYTAHCGMRRVKGNGGDPILPFFMLDTMYQILKKDIWPVPCRHEAKRERNLWLKSYTAFNRDFFSSLDSDQEDYVIDLMDSFEEFISTDVLIAKVAVMNQVARHGLSFEDQAVVSSAMICHILAQTASIVWDAVYKAKHYNLMATQYMESILKHCSNWMNMFFCSKSDAHVNPNEDKQICDAVNILCKKMIKFLTTIE